MQRSRRYLLYKPSYSQFCLKIRCHGNRGHPVVNLNDAIRLAICHFLLVSHWNRASISNRFRDIWPQNPCAHTDTRHKWFYNLSHAMYCIGQTINTSRGTQIRETLWLCWCSPVWWWGPQCFPLHLGRLGIRQHLLYVCVGYLDGLGAVWQECRWQPIFTRGDRLLSKGYVSHICYLTTTMTFISHLQLVTFDR